MKVHGAVKKAQTLNCMLCRGLVAYTKGNRERFDSHMAIEHGIAENMSYILAGCLMNQDERDVVAAIIEEREGTKLEPTEGEVAEEATEGEEGLDPLEEVLEEDASAGKAAEVVDKAMECEQCGEKFREKRSLWLHRRSNHKDAGKEKPKRKRASGSKRDEEPLQKKSTKLTEQEGEGDEEDKEATLNEEALNETEEAAESKGKKRKSLRASKEKKVLEEDEAPGDNKEKESEEAKAKKVDTETECDECEQAFKDMKGLKYHKFKEHKGIQPLEEEEDNIRELFPSPSVKKDKKSPKSGKSTTVEEVEEAAQSEEGLDVEAKQAERQRVIKESEYFSSHPKEIAIYMSKADQSIRDGESLPPGWLAVERINISGTKIMSFINPDKVLSFRSRVGMFEFIKFSQLYSEAELETFSKMVKTRKSI